MATVTGVPQPTHEWAKNESPIEQNERVVTSVKENLVTLTVRNCKRDDQGNYTIIATNPSGSDSGVLHLIVKGENSKISKFLDYLTDLKF